MDTERDIRVMLVYDPNSQDSLDMLCSLDIGEDTDKIEVQRVRQFLPGIRTTPAIGVILWASDKQGLMENVSRFVGYVQQEDATLSALQTLGVEIEGE